MLQQHPHLTPLLEQALHKTENQPLCAYKDHSRKSLYKIHRHTHTWTKNVGHKSEKSSQIHGSMLYISRQCWKPLGLGGLGVGWGGLGEEGGNKRTFSFWLPLGDQNECCIESVTKTLKKAMEAMLGYMTPTFKCLPAVPRRQAGRF